MTLPASLPPGAMRPSRHARVGTALPAQALGRLAYGAPAAAGGALPLPLLAGSAALADDWCVAGPITRGQTGALHWAHDGHWLHGSARVAAAEGELEDAAYALYRDVFATLQAQQVPHLVRLWNYLPRINVHTQGLERYRQFNIGRQRAFIDSGGQAFEGAPAACAIGTVDGELTLHVLAARHAPLALENPRQVPAWRYPSAYGPRSPTFSRAALVALGAGHVALWISGTASIVGHASLHAGDVRAQTEETLANLRAVIAAAQAHTDARLGLDQLHSCTYVRHAADAAVVRQVLDGAWGADSPAARDAVYVQADICRAELLVEVEGHLVVPGRLLA